MRNFCLAIILLLSAAVAPQAREKAACTRVFDGDTLKLFDGRKVRLIGVDTPESYHPSKPREYGSSDAEDFTRKAAEGRAVWLEYGAEKTDRYGRTLAYVYLEDGTLLNAELIKRGYGYAMTHFPFSRMEEFRKYESEARKRGLGVWKGGGAAELAWLVRQKAEPFFVYPMEQNLWGLRCGGFLKARMTGAELVENLKNLRSWMNECSPSDLAKALRENGWSENK